MPGHAQGWSTRRRQEYNTFRPHNSLDYLPPASEAPNPHLLPGPIFG
ncbi:MAG: transposase [Deltaproteobacteria bacterium]|nr:transposase [Deltaproteobacteria bacterium]